MTINICIKIDRDLPKMITGKVSKIIFRKPSFTTNLFNTCSSVKICDLFSYFSAYNLIFLVEIYNRKHILKNDIGYDIRQFPEKEEELFQYIFSIFTFYLVTLFARSGF